MYHLTEEIRTVLNNDIMPQGNQTECHILNHKQNRHAFLKQTGNIKNRCAHIVYKRCTHTNQRGSYKTNIHIENRHAHKKQTCTYKTNMHIQNKHAQLEKKQTDTHT